jgi:2,4-dienoyl-CoA reductase-like NADH-dependent reductase (Old Yellow Enzyme family)
MGHGYLLSQFISPMYNKRRDQYGGSLENRLRFPRRVLRAVLDAVGHEMAVICKYSVTEGFAPVTVPKTGQRSPACWNRKAPTCWCSVRG